MAKCFIDYQPLISLLGGHKDLNDLPIRIIRLRMRRMSFAYTISQVAGKSLIIPGMFSRSPVIHSLTEEEEQHPSDTEIYFYMVIKHLPLTDPRLQEIREKQSRDIICQTCLITVSIDGLKQNIRHQREGKCIGLSGVR